MIIVTYLLSKTLETKNISSAIGKLATENELSIANLSFKLKGVNTYIKTTADDDFKLYKDDPLNYYNDSDKVINERVEFQQLYIITIIDDAKSIIKLKYDVNYSENNIEPYIILHPDSEIPYKKYKPKEIYMLLLRELNSIKAKNGILTLIFDEKMKEKLKAFTKYLYKGKFTKKVKIPLFSGIVPKVARNSQLIMYFLKKESKYQVIEVEEGELLVKFIKPLFGKNGLDAFGKIVDNSYSSNQDDLECYVDKKTIQIVEDNEKKLYRSKIKGYVHFSKDNFYIDNRLKMKQLSRIQESVSKDEANKIEVVIAQQDSSLDSLGEGVELISETIHITGHIGAKSTLKAVNLTIDGATHQDSLQESKFAEINRHKGKLRCNSAKIKLLEGGEVHATNVDIENSLGGTIYAENVTLGHVKNNLKVYASNSITIQRVSGEDNLFMINYEKIPTLNSRFNFISKEIEELKYKLEGALKHSAEQVPILKDKIKDLVAKQNKIINAVKSAKITIKEALRGLNTITFTIDEDHELTFKTDARTYKPFYLVESDNSITLHPTDKKISIED